LSKAFYNEIDPKAAAWLRELIKQGHIAPGDVDERSIVDIQPSDLRGYTQCHFFAGIGVWSHALRCAGWGDDRPVWTGSCPCQPFSAAGKRCGTDDARHLWPEFFRLINECRPVTVFGEQVASKDGLAWLDAVHVDLEGAGYTVGAVDSCAAGFGAPHIRQRIYFVAHTEIDRSGALDQESRSGVRQTESAGGPGFPIGLADADHAGPQGRGCGVVQERAGERAVGQNGGPCNGFWSNAEWLPCRDGKSRPVESCLEPLADGLAGELGLVRLISYPDRPHEERIIYAPLIQKGKARVMRLKGYGNAIVAPQATEFIKAYMEVCG